MNFNQRLGVNLRRVRENAGLSQEGLMRISDVHRTQISSYERGETEPQAEALAKLSRALGVSAEEFFAGIAWQPDPPRLVVEPVEAGREIRHETVGKDRGELQGEA